MCAPWPRCPCVFAGRAIPRSSRCAARSICPGRASKGSIRMPGPGAKNSSSTRAMPPRAACASSIHRSPRAAPCRCAATASACSAAASCRGATRRFSIACTAGACDSTPSPGWCGAYRPARTTTKSWPGAGTACPTTSMALSTRSTTWHCNRAWVLSPGLRAGRLPASFPPRRSPPRCWRWSSRSGAPVPSPRWRGCSRCLSAGSPSATPPCTTSTRLPAWACTSATG